MGPPISSPETSDTNYQSKLGKIPEEGRFHLHRVGSLNSRTLLQKIVDLWELLTFRRSAVRLGSVSSGRGTTKHVDIWYLQQRTVGAFSYSAPIVRTQQRGLILATLHELLYPEDAATTFHPTASVTSRYGDSLRAGSCGDRIPVGMRFSARTQTGRGVYPVTDRSPCRVSFQGVQRLRRGVNRPPHISPKLTPSLGLCVLVWSYFNLYHSQKRR